MFEANLAAYVLELLAMEIKARATPAADPLVTDSWVARSIMQKAIRRGMLALALRAAAQLLVLDRRVLWRRLLVTALEDLGPGQADLAARISAASRDSAWRAREGGEWPVVAELITQACDGTRCQSANDLWNVGKNDPALDGFKASLCDARLDDLVAVAVDETMEIGERGAAVLIAVGEDAGPAAPDHIQSDPAAVFNAFAEAGSYSHVAASYHQAYRQTRLALAPLSLCLWRSSSTADHMSGSDDDLPPVGWAGNQPTFVFDQYVRGGKAAIRSYVARSTAWAAFAEEAGVARSSWIAAAGELLFRADGARVTNRRAWATGLDLYARSMRVGCFMEAQWVDRGLALIVRELPLIDQLRGGPTFPSHPAGACQ